MIRVDFRILKKKNWERKIQILSWKSWKNANNRDQSEEINSSGIKCVVNSYGVKDNTYIKYMVTQKQVVDNKDTTDHTQERRKYIVLTQKSRGE